MKTLREEKAIVLDFLPNGYPFDSRPIHKKTPIIQAIGKDHFILLELIPKKDAVVNVQEVVYIGEGKRDKIHHILGRMPFDKLTQTGKGELEFVIKEMVNENRQRFVDFFTNSGPINTRRHQIELLPGIGKKHMWEILEARKDGSFKSFEDVKKRVKLIPDPETMIIKRLLMEIREEDKYRLFVGT